MTIKDSAQFREGVVVGIRCKVDASHVRPERAGEGNDFESLETLVAHHDGIGPDKLRPASRGRKR
jgi:hypothetical protein